jgi:DnaJ-class molecular chaperone
MRDYIKNMDYEDIIDNVIDKVETFSEFMDSKKTNLEYTEDLYINANIDLFDIYNNIEKTINIERSRKCEACKTIKLEHCSECNSMKYINKNVELIFECKLKNIVFDKLSHHYPNKTPGNIIININPKEHTFYNIYNNYDLIYNIVCHEYLNSDKYVFSIKHLDNKNYSFKILNPQLNYKYKVEQLGLLHNSDEVVRGDLYIILHKNIDINTNIIKI